MRIAKDLGIGQWDTIAVSLTGNVANLLFIVTVLRLIYSIQDLEKTNQTSVLNIHVCMNKVSF